MTHLTLTTLPKVKIDKDKKLFRKNTIIPPHVFSFSGEMLEHPWAY